MGSAGWVPKEPSFPITDLEPGMPAEKAGMKLGDEIIDVDGQAHCRPRRHDREPEADQG